LFLDTRPDSGVDLLEDSNLQVHLPPESMSSTKTLQPDSKVLTVPQHVLRGTSINASYSDSSREGSLDDINLLDLKKSRDINDTSQSGKKKRKTSYNRQPSKDSQRSTGKITTVLCVF